MIHYQTMPPQAILVSDWPIFLKSSPMAKAHIAFGKVC
jgi:hypothetical protein